MDSKDIFEKYEGACILGLELGLIIAVGLSIIQLIERTMHPDTNPLHSLAPTVLHQVVLH